MAQPGGAAQQGKRRSGALGWLLAGVVLGVLGTIFLPELAGPYLPDSLRGDEVEVAGVVEAKSTEAERLLLTVGSEAGATLVTFREDIAEIDLLVSVGDSVLLAVDEYAPFVNDARISRVMKQRDWRPAAGQGPADTAEAEGADTAGAATGDAEEGAAADGAGAEGAPAPARSDTAEAAPGVDGEDAAADTSSTDASEAREPGAGRQP